MCVCAFGNKRARYIETLAFFALYCVLSLSRALSRDLSLLSIFLSVCFNLSFFVQLFLSPGNMTRERETAMVIDIVLDCTQYVC